MNAFIEALATNSGKTATSLAKRYIGDAVKYSTSYSEGLGKRLKEKVYLTCNNN